MSRPEPSATQAVAWTRLYWIFALGAALLTLWLAWINRLTFPHPCNDEVRFYLPALALVTRSSFTVPLLHAPEGMFWVPDGLYLWLALPMRLFGAGIEHARTMCELSVAAAVFVWSLALRRVAGPNAGPDWISAAATLVLVSPPVLLAANEVRMEAPIFLLLGLALLLHTLGQRLCSVALLLLAVLFHPVTGIAFAAYAATTALTWIVHRPEPARPRWPALLLCALVGLAVLLEAWHFRAHWPVVQQQMSYQVQRKVGRALLPLFLKPQGLLLAAEIAATAWMGLQRSEWTFLAPLAAAALGLQLAAVAGGEMNYDVYSLAATPALFFAMAARVFIAARGALPDRGASQARAAPLLADHLDQARV